MSTWRTNHSQFKRKDYYSALETAQILEDDSDQESDSSSDDSLDREGEESVVQTGDVDIGAILRSEAQREERAELENERKEHLGKSLTGNPSKHCKRCTNVHICEQSSP